MFGPESAFHWPLLVTHEHLLRNEGAVGSNPITSTTRTAFYEQIEGGSRVVEGVPFGGLW